MGIGAVRVSTDKQFHDGDSLTSQIERIEKAAKRDNVALVRFFMEHYSGRKTDRVVIRDMLNFLDENPDVKVVYINEINRFTRGGSEVYLYMKRQLLQRGVELKDVFGVIQSSVNTLADLDVEYEWSRTSPSRTAEVMQAEFANIEARQILTRVISQEIRLTRQGYQTRSPLFGFRNEKITRPDGKKATIMVPREPEASWIKTIFSLRAEGGLSDKEICKRVNAMGFKSRKQHRRDKITGDVYAITGGNPLTPKQVQRYVKTTLYCGVRCERWTNFEPIRTPFPGLVSIDLFNRANLGAIRIIEATDGSLVIETGESRKKRSWKENPEFLLRHVVACPECGKPLWASKSTGKSGKRFGYFHCSRKGHPAVRYKQAEFEETVGKYLESLQFKPGFIGLLKESVREVWIERHRSIASEHEMVDQHIDRLRAKQSMLIERLATIESSVVQERLEHQIEEIETAIQTADENRPSVRLSEQQIEQFFAKVRAALEHPADYAMTAVTQEIIEKKWRRIFQTPPTLEELSGESSGTPQLSLLYRLGTDPEVDKRQLVHALSSHWNTFEDELLLWLDKRHSSELISS